MIFIQTFSLGANINRGPFTQSPGLLILKPTDSYSTTRLALPVPSLYSILVASQRAGVELHDILILLCIYLSRYNIVLQFPVALKAEPLLPFLPVTTAVGR